VVGLGANEKKLFFCAVNFEKIFSAAVQLQYFAPICHVVDGKFSFIHQQFSPYIEFLFTVDRILLCFRKKYFL
jgi:hypothetical protein